MVGQLPDISLPRCSCGLDHQGIQTEALSVAVEHFRTDSHTGVNILKHYQQITEEYGMISFSAPVVTDKGSNMVSGLRDSPRLDCICHRLHTVFTDAYKEAQRLVPKVKNMKTRPQVSVNM